MHRWISGLLVLCLSTSAFARFPYVNQREEGSYYVKEKQRERARILYDLSSKAQVKKKLEESLKSPNVFLCASKISEGLKSQFDDSEAALAAMRDLQLIDDFAYDLIGKALNFKYQVPIPVSTASLQQNRPRIIEAFKDYLRKEGRGVCGEDNYRDLVNKLRKFADKFNKRFLKRAHYLALKEDIITKDQFRNLEMFRQSKVFEWEMTLKDYSDKIRGLRTQYQIPEDELSSFVVGKEKKEKRSRRQALFEKYSYFQIILMGNLIKKMRTRLEASDIQIHILDDNGGAMEIIDLDPMERFRFILKMLRKEMDELSNHTLFNGVKPAYTEIITAAFEIGLIPADEMNEMAGLEEIWSPRKSRWEKIMYWVRTFGTVGAAVIPHPWGFVSVLAIMGIESLTTNQEQEDERDFSLF